MGKKSQQLGAVSLFSVVFATLLLTVLVTGFIQLMVRDQRQATNNDLSQSAYDAALAGVEDAKRVVRSSQEGNDQASDALGAPSDCMVIQRSGVVATSTDDSEVKVKSTNTNGVNFDQAYTCVNLAMDTPDYLYESREDKTQLIPLKSSNVFNQIAIEWYTREDSGSAVVTRPTSGNDLSLPKYSDWGNTSSVPGLPSTSSSPPIMQAQVITPGDQIDLNSLNNTGRTAFIRPLAVNATASELSVDLKAGSPRVGEDNVASNSSPHAVTCTTRFSFNDEYSCRVVINIDEVSESASRNAFLRLSTIYSGAHVRVTLLNNGAKVSFNGVQPSVDSTGRTNNLFRRVEARLQLGDDFPYPEAAADISGDICKDFSVTDEKAIPNPKCNPAD